VSGLQYRVRYRVLGHSGAKDVLDTPEEALSALTRAQETYDEAWLETRQVSPWMRAAGTVQVADAVREVPEYVTLPTGRVHAVSHRQSLRGASRPIRTVCGHELTGDDVTEHAQVPSDGVSCKSACHVHIVRARRDAR